MNENRPIHFAVASNIFPPYFLLDGLAVRSEHLEFVLTVSLEVIVQGLPADGAPHPRFAILPVEKDNVALENRTFFGRRKCQVVPLKVPLHAVDDKGFSALTERPAPSLDVGVHKRRQPFNSHSHKEKRDAEQTEQEAGN